MRNILLFLCLGAVLSAGGSPLPPHERAAKTAKEAVHRLHTMMKSRVKPKMKEGGVPAAAAFCAEESYKMIEQLDRELGPDVSIKRVSLRNRNPASYPLPEEEDIVRAFELIEASDAYLPKAIVQMVDARTYKVYLPATMSSRNCKKCHGTESEIDPAVRSYLKERYPQDRATGFRSGQVRGAVIVTVTTTNGEAPRQRRDDENE